MTYNVFGGMLSLTQSILSICYCFSDVVNDVGPILLLRVCFFARHLYTCIYWSVVVWCEVNAGFCHTGPVSLCVDLSAFICVYFVCFCFILQCVV